MHVKNKNFGNFVYILPKWQMRKTKIKKTFAASLLTCSHHMVILRSQNNYMPNLAPAVTSTGKRDRGVNS